MIFGPTFWAGASAIVTVDGTRVGTFTTLADGVTEPLPQQLVYMRGDMDPLQPHQVQISYNPADYGETSRKWLGIDFVVVDETRWDPYSLFDVGDELICVRQRTSGFVVDPATHGDIVSASHVFRSSRHQPWAYRRNESSTLR